MANPTTIDGAPAVIEAGTAAGYVAMNSTREYTLQHMGVDATGAEATDAVFLSTDGAPEATYDASAQKAVLQSGKALVIGPGVSTLGFIVASGSPVFQLIPSPRLLY